MRLRFLIVLSILALCFTALTPHPVHAVGNIVVNTALDVGPDHQDGLCSLRVAIISATGNSNSSDDDCATGVSDDLDVIHIAPSLAGQTLTITTPLPQIYSTISTDTLEIIGPTDQSSGFTINGNNQTRIFELGLSTVPGNLTLSNITVRGGNANGTAGWTTPGDGGAIYVSGTNSRLTLNNVVLRNNTAPGTPGVDGGAAARSSSTKLRPLPVTVALSSAIPRRVQEMASVKARGWAAQSTFLMDLSLSTATRSPSMAIRQQARAG